MDSAFFLVKKEGIFPGLNNHLISLYYKLPDLRMSEGVKNNAIPTAFKSDKLDQMR
jgi:hypothetical protein